MYKYTHTVKEYMSQGYIIKMSLFDIQHKRSQFHHTRSLVNLVQLLYDHGASSTAAVADSSHTILAGLQLVEQCNQNTRAGTAQSVSNGDRTSKKVDLGIL